jgi:hypothetical protein
MPDESHIEITEEDVQALRDAAFMKHVEWACANPRHMSLRCFCVCGYSSTPIHPTEPVACRALRKLLDEAGQ